MGTLFYVLVVAIIGVIITFVLVPDVPVTGKEIVLGSGGYDVVPLEAPVLSGKVLDIFSNVFSISRLGPLIKRVMINQNNVAMLRSLASQVELAPMYYPMHRMHKAEREAHEAIAATPEASLANALETGLQVDRKDKVVAPSVVHYAEMYRSGKARPSEVMQKAMAAAREWEKQGFIIFTSLIESDVLEQARKSDERHKNGNPLSIFDGVPVAFKDSINVTNHPMYDGKHPSVPVEALCEVDDVIVARFRALGAIIFGVTVMTEGGTSPFGYSLHFHGPFNPYSTSFYSGGSSSGSAVAVATGLVPVAVGFDGGGSIRLPSHFSGLHGIATTWGRVAYEPAFGSLTKSGPLAANAVDAALAYAVMAPNSPGHFYETLYDGGVNGVPTPHFHQFNDIHDLSGVRLGIFKEWFDDSDPEVRKLVQNAVDYMVGKGATIVPVTIPHLQWMSLSHAFKIASEFASVFDTHLWSHSEKLEPNTRIVAGIGSTVSALEVLSGEYLRAWGYKYIRDLFIDNDLTAIVTPTAPMVAPELTPAAKDSGETNNPLAVRMMKYVYVANFLGLPGYSVPVGFADAKAASTGVTAKLPVALQLIGTHWTEDKLMRLAHSIEQGHSNRGHMARPNTVYSFRPF
jgi:Asp-tRNA(Asn)/Glu-tRNA(Gln) amidotransferase A subunit family amidase